MAKIPIIGETYLHFLMIKMAKLIHGKYVNKTNTVGKW